MIDGSRSLTRAQVLETSERWASVLVEAGCGREVPVAVVLPRGADALIAVLAVLEAGGAYVPISPDSAPDQIEAIIKDCGAPIVITADRLLGQPPSGADVVLTPMTIASRVEDATAVPQPSSGRDLAYIFYTSGTMGEPKGVEGTHRQLVNYALWCQGAFAHRPGELTFLSASLFFLGSLTTIFTPLVSGWPIVVVPDGASTDTLADLARQTEGGLLKLTPTHIRMLMARGVPEGGLARQLMVGSEPLAFSREIKQWMGADRQRVVVNHYGLTETHGCFCHWLTGAEEVGSSVPIGKPIDNLDAYIVDRDFEPVPVGEVGELLVGGPSIARGYRGQPELTAERWVPHPWRDDGARLLSTGDLARMDADGVVTLLGRADRQVKIRGHRVEPAALEEALRAFPGVEEALVLPKFTDGKARLDAYLLREEGVVVEAVAVRDVLRTKFPPQWIPARMMVMSEFPVNANGKVDTRALPELAPIGDGTDAGGSGRWSRADRAVAEAFCEVLKIDDIGLADSFYDLGGDSQTAVEVAARLGQQMGRDIPPPTGDAATVRAYAQLINSPVPATGGSGAVTRPSASVALTASPRAGDGQTGVPLSFGQMSVYRVMRTLPLNRWAETYLVDVVPIPADRTDDDIVMALKVVAQRHESLRSRFLDGPGGPRQAVSAEWRPDLARVDLPGCGEEQVTKAVRDTCRQPFDWDAGSCWRAVIVTDEGRPVFLGIIVDHIVSDGWGLRRVVAEIRALLGIGGDRDRALLAEVPSQPQQLADLQRSDEWQRRRGATTRYWDGLLRDLSADVFPWSVAGSVGRVGAVVRSARARHALGVAAHRLGTSPHNVLLSLYTVAAREVLGRRDLALTLQAGNRSLPRWRGIVSSMNQYAPVPVVGAPVDGDFTRLAETVRKVSLNAYWHGMYDLDSVREQVFRARGVELNFDCFFNWLAYDVRKDDGTGPPPDESPAVVERVRPSRQVGPRLDLKVQGGDILSITARVDPALLPEERLVRLMMWFEDELWRLGTSAERGIEEMTRRCAHVVRGPM